MSSLPWTAACIRALPCSLAVCPSALGAASASAFEPPARAEADAEVDAEAEAEAEEERRQQWQGEGEGEGEGDDEDGEEFLLNEVVGAAAIYPQDKAEIQLTLVSSYQDRREDHLGSISYVVEIGATDWWQFEVGWVGPVMQGGRGVPTEVGIGDLELATQLTWMHMRGSPFSAALVFEVGVPLRFEETEFSEGTVEYEPFFTFAVDPPSGRAQVFTNVGIELSPEEQEPFVNVGVIGAASITRPYLVASYTPEESYLVPGMSLILPKGWEIIVGMPMGLSPTSARIGAGLILIYEFNPLLMRRR